jgi:hypothetical protein
MDMVWEIPSNEWILPKVEAVMSVVEIQFVKKEKEIGE